jgi:cytochrome c
VRFSARGSRDPDGDALRYDWQFGEKGAGQTGADVTWTYAEPGVRTAALVVTDSHGLSHRTAVTVAVGNAPPVVRIGAPAHGSFFDWGQPLAFAVTVADPEDGSTAGGAIAPAAVEARWHYRDEHPTDQGLAAALGSDPGAAIMRRSDCLSCHQVATPSIGPSFLGIAERYREDTGAAARLAAKIREGGAGAWGDVPMPPHPQHTAAEAAAMAGAILAVRPPSAGEPIAGLSGPLPVLARPRNPMHEKNAGGSYVFTVSYRDRGAAGAPPLTGEARVVVHARRRRAALFDAGEGVAVMEVSTLRRDRRVCAQLQAGGYLCIRAVNLAGIARIACEVSAGTGHGGTLELRADGVDGPLIGQVEVPETGLWENWRTVSASVVDPGGVRDLYVVARPDPTRPSRRLNLDVLEFVPVLPSSPAQP